MRVEHTLEDPTALPSDHNYRYVLVDGQALPPLPFRERVGVRVGCRLDQQRLPQPLRGATYRQFR